MLFFILKENISVPSGIPLYEFDCGFYLCRVSSIEKKLDSKEHCIFSLVKREEIQNALIIKENSNNHKDKCKNKNRNFSKK